MEQIDQNSLDDIDSLKTDDSNEISPKKEKEEAPVIIETIESNHNSFINKIDKVNTKKMNEGEQDQRPYVLSQYIQEKEEQKIQKTLITDDSREEFAKQRVKPKKEMEAGLIIKERSLPQHKMIRRKAMSILKYNFDY